MVDEIFQPPEYGAGGCQEGAETSASRLVAPNLDQHLPGAVGIGLLL